MLHYSCDRCHQSIGAPDAIRYVLKIEVQLAAENCQDIALGDASVEELEQLLENIGHPVCEDGDHGGERNFDLCSECYAKYVANPLALESMCVEFSKN